MAKESSKTQWQGRHAIFTMDLTLEDKTVYTIKVDLDCNAPFEVMQQYVAGGQSGRVTMQQTMRTLERSVLARLQREGLKIKVGELRDRNAYLAPEDKARAAEVTLRNIIANLTPEQAKAMAAMLQAKTEE
jgi:hypothetical protein